MDFDLIIPDIHKYNGAVVDANLLLLLFIGLIEPAQIGRKRLSAFDDIDLEILVAILKRFDGRLFITTNIMSEICNLSDYFNEKTDHSFFESLIISLKAYKEKSSSILQIIDSDKVAFLKFGLTDATIVKLAKKNILVITVDLPLCHYLESQKFPVINFTRLKAYH